MILLLIKDIIESKDEESDDIIKNDEKDESELIEYVNDNVYSEIKERKCPKMLK